MTIVNHKNNYFRNECLDMCGRVLLTRHEVGGGICWHCLSAGDAYFSEGEVALWETETTAAWEDDDGIDEDEKLMMLINGGLASIWPSPVFEKEDTSTFITVTKGQQWFAVEMWWNTEEDFLQPGEGFWEPWQTGMGRYDTAEAAAQEAQAWALETGTCYVPSTHKEA